MNANLVSKITSHNWGSFMRDEKKYLDFVNENSELIEPLLKIFAIKVSTRNSYGGTIQDLRKYGYDDILIGNKEEPELEKKNIDLLMGFENIPGLDLYNFIDRIDSWIASEVVNEDSSYMTRQQQFNHLSEEIKLVKTRHIKSGSQRYFHESFI